MSNPRAALFTHTPARTVNPLAPNPVVTYESLGLSPRCRGYYRHFECHRVVACASVERAKELTKQITAADDWRDVVTLLQEDEIVNLRHLTTAMYFITKNSRPRGNILHDKELLRELGCIADRITRSTEPWSSASLVNVLQACSRLVGPRCSYNRTAFDSLLSMALSILVTGAESSLSNVEYLTILSCLAHVPNSPEFPGKTAATRAVEKALIDGDEGPVLLRTKGLEGFHPRDLGALAWALTEAKCSEETAQLVYDHCITKVGAKNLSASALCLACRMISMQGARELAGENLMRAAAGVADPSVLRRLSSLRDSSMMLLAIARMMKSVCEDEVKIEESLSFGVKWTFAVVSYRKAHPSIDRLVNTLCSFIGRDLAQHETAASADKGPSNSVGSTGSIASSDPGVSTSSRESEVSHSVFSGILYSLALLQYPSEAVISSCTRGLARIHRKLTLRTIATCTWSLAVLRYEDSHILRVFARRMVSDRLLLTHLKVNRSGKGGMGGKGGKGGDRVWKGRSDGRDTAQSVSMMLYGFAVLNLLDADSEGESDMVALLDLLMKAVKPSLMHLGPEVLPVLGWSIVIAHSREGSMDTEIFGSAVQAWRQAVSDAFSSIPAQGRPMIHHTEIALALEAPHLPGCGSIANVPFEPLMGMLYSSGRLRRHALREWNAQSHSVALDGISLFQKQVFTAAERVYPGWQMEYWDDRLQYPVDMALPEQRIVIEADGPTHFMINTHKAVGATALKRRLLKKLGWRLVVVPYYEWSIEGSDDAHVTFLRSKLGFLAGETEKNGSGQTQGDPAAKTPEQRMDKTEDEVTAKIWQKNASKLETIRALQGKMTIKEVIRRRSARQRIMNDDCNL